MADNITPLNPSSSMSKLAKVRKTISSLEDDNQWFDGTRSSMDQRVDQIRSVVRQSKALIQDPDVDYIDSALLDATSKRLAREAKTLSEISKEFVSAESQESMQKLPSFSVASENRDPQLGEVDPKLKRKAADRIISADEDWADFVNKQPVKFVQRNSRFINKSLRMREEATNYAEYRTRTVESRLVRSQLIEDFVTQVELVRRHS